MGILVPGTNTHTHAHQNNHQSNSTCFSHILGCVYFSCFDACKLHYLEVLLINSIDNDEHIHRALLSRKNRWLSIGFDLWLLWCIVNITENSNHDEFHVEIIFKPRLGNSAVGM